MGEAFEPYYVTSGNVGNDQIGWDVIRRSDSKVLGRYSFYDDADKARNKLNQHGVDGKNPSGNYTSHAPVVTNDAERIANITKPVYDGGGELPSGWTTKDSGERAEFSSGMVRDTDKGKPRFDLLFPEAVPYEDQMITRWAALMARGAEKYTERNWEQAETREEYNRYMSSAIRHFHQWFCGEDDEDHAAAVFFNIMGAEYVASRLLAEDE